MTDRAGWLLNGRYLTRPPTGVDRFAIETVAALGRMRPDAPLATAVPSGEPVRAASVADVQRVQSVGRRAGHAWEQIDLARAAAGRTLVNLCNTAPMLRERQLVVIHDVGTVANASNYTAAFRAWYRLMHGVLMRRARVVATVSSFSAGELAAHFGARRRGIEVVPEGGEHILAQPADASVLDRLQVRGRRYVLAVGSRSPNKNFAAVEQALALLDDPTLLLVAVGGAAPRIYADGAEPVAATGADGDRVRRAGFVSDAELRALYEHAACFVFPSYYEGFGLPPLEAMCCGCPVVVSDRASLPEVCGSGALYCKAEDPSTLADALRRLLGSTELRHELREAGRERAATFGWAKAARHVQQILDVHFA